MVFVFKFLYSKAVTMVNTNWGAKWRSPHVGMILGFSCLLLGGTGVAYWVWLSRPMQQQIAVTTAPSVETVSALGRLEPEGEVIQVFAPRLRRVRESKP